MTRGSYARDLAYCLGTCVPVEKRREIEDEVLAFYLEKLPQFGGPKLDLDQVWFDIRCESFTSLGYWSLTLTPDAESRLLSVCMCSGRKLIGFH